MASDGEPLSEGRVLVVEDDAELLDIVIRGLEEEGFTVRGTARGAELLEMATADPPDALVIDVGLPDSDGRDVCQALRASGVQSPVLFLTARDALTDRLSGFSAGGDDYLVKPFAFAELVARLRALARRGGAESALDVGGLHLDPGAHAASCGGVTEPLTPTEFRLLAALAGNRGSVVRRRDLIRAAWPEGAIVHDNTLDAYLARVRRKLRRLPGAPSITTVHGVGYVIR